MPGVSNEPWSNFKESDYTLAQWQRACLIHQYTGTPASKADCKLPVRTPTGVLNRNAVHAAAAALAGARGGVQATDAEKMKAASQLVRLYGELNEDPPPSLSHDETSRVENFLAHLNDAGQNGGKFDEGKVKRDKGGKFAKKQGGDGHDPLDTLWLQDAQLAANMASIVQELAPDLEALYRATAQKYGLSVNALESNPTALKEVVDGGIAMMNARAVAPGPGPGVSPSGKMRMEFHAGADNAPHVRAVPYSGPNPHPSQTQYLKKLQRDIKAGTREKSTFRFNPNAVLDPSRVHEASNLRVLNFLEHVGVKGMKWGVTKSSSGGAGGRRVLTVTGKGTPKVGQTVMVDGKSHTITRASQSTKGTHVVATKPTSKVTPAEKAVLKVQGKSFVAKAMGDKTYWQRAAIIAGVGTAGITAAALGPAVLPASVLLAAGGTAAYSAKVTVASLAAYRIGGSLNYINYVRRVQDQVRTAVHSALQHDGPTVQDVFNGMSADKQDAAAILIAAAVNGKDVSDDSELDAAWSSMSDSEKAVTYFLANVADSNKDGATVTHTDINAVENFLQHFGRKGMKWGQRIFSRGSSSSSSTGETAKAEARPLSDAHRAALIQAKVHKHGLTALSNDEIKTLTDRLNLEVNYAKVAANKTKLARGRKFMDNQLKTGKTLNEMHSFIKSPAGSLLRAMIRPGEKPRKTILRDEFPSKAEEEAAKNS